MSSRRQPDDGLLTRYLLGSLPEEETERLDEMSVTDDEIAWRLRAVENDLVDAYVRGEMSGGTLERFRSTYLASPERRKKVVVAKALLALRPARPVADERPAMARVSRFPIERWALAASLAAIAAGGAYLYFVPRSAPNVPHVVTARNAPTPQATRVSPALATVSFVLSPPTRGGTVSLPALAVPAGTQLVNLRLQLESDDFPEYEAALRNLATNEIVWRSAAAKASLDGAGSAVGFDLPAGVLKPQNYSIELSGLPQNGRAELIASYAFRAAPP
ncbi:MAG TPA: hypothetical protein VF980_19885 [Thermoanaerobaculia bacterium]